MTDHWFSGLNPLWLGALAILFAWSCARAVRLALAMRGPAVRFQRDFELSQGEPDARPAVFVSLHSATDSQGRQHDHA